MTKKFKHKFRPPSLLERIQLYKKASELDNIEAINKLAYIYFYDIEFMKDINKAIEFYKKASGLNDIEAINKLANIYENGAEGIDKDINKAIELYKKAVELNDSSAMTNLCNIYVKQGKIKEAVELQQKLNNLKKNNK